MKAKKIAKRELKYAGSKKLRAVYRHTRRMVTLSEVFLEWFLENFRASFGTAPYAYKKLLIRAAYLHDLLKAFPFYAKVHHKKWALREALGEYDLSHEKALVDVIAAHKGKFNPPEDYELESAILRICDKLDKFYKGQWDAWEKCEDSLAKIREVLDEKTGAVFEKTYREMLAAVIWDVKNANRRFA